ncbi:MAG: fused signal recognition particle receptor, partial [Actinomycetota bacterium]|nr:fused signal recognition particle receptor [Actinomycetota bacterium]
MVTVILIAAAILAVAGITIAFVGLRTRPRRDELPGEPRDVLIAPPAEAEAPPEAPPAPVEVEAPEVVEPEVIEPEVIEPEVIEPARLRDRLGRTRTALAGYLRGVRGRKIDADTWDELEEALLLA